MTTCRVGCLTFNLCVTFDLLLQHFADKGNTLFMGVLLFCQSLSIPTAEISISTLSLPGLVKHFLELS